MNDTTAKTLAENALGKKVVALFPTPAMPLMRLAVRIGGGASASDMDEDDATAAGSGPLLKVIGKGPTWEAALAAAGVAVTVNPQEQAPADAGVTVKPRDSATDPAAQGQPATMRTKQEGATVMTRKGILLEVTNGPKGVTLYIKGAGRGEGDVPELEATPSLDRAYLWKTASGAVRYAGVLADRTLPIHTVIKALDGDTVTAPKVEAPVPPALSAAEKAGLEGAKKAAVKAGILAPGGRPLAKEGTSLRKAQDRAAARNEKLTRKAAKIAAAGKKGATPVNPPEAAGAKDAPAANSNVGVAGLPEAALASTAKKPKGKKQLMVKCSDGTAKCGCYDLGTTARIMAALATYGTTHEVTREKAISLAGLVARRPEDSLEALLADMPANGTGVEVTAAVQARVRGLDGAGKNSH